MKSEEGYQALFEHYPNVIEPGLILGDAEAIVGQFGLTVCIMLPNNEMSVRLANCVGIQAPTYKEHRKFFENNERLPVIKFMPHGLLINVGFLEPALLSYEKFKDFSFKNQLFI